MNEGFVYGVVFPLALWALGCLLRRSNGAWWRLAELPGVIKGRVSDWVVVGIERLRDRVILRAIVTVGYLTSTVSQINESARELAGRIVKPESASEARAQAWHLLRALLQRPSALVALASGLSVVDMGVALAMCANGDFAGSMGHFATPFVMALVILALSKVEGGLRTVTGEASLGLVIWALRSVALCSVVALAAGEYWAKGSEPAHWVGAAGLTCAIAGGLAPIRRWLERDYIGWRQWWTATLVMLSAFLGFVATILELLTYRNGAPAAAVLANVIGATTWLGAGYILAVLAHDPPAPAELNPAAL